MDRVSPYIRYPHGAGGMWLSHVVWCLEHRQFEVDESTPVNFHQHAVTDSIEFGHVVNSDQDLVFGGAYGFQYYLNFWHKHRVKNNYLKFNDLLPYQQFHELSNEAQWIISSNDWTRMYAHNVDIDFGNMWQNQTKFVEQLFAILDQLSIQYTHNSDFVLRMIAQYQRSCVPVTDFIGSNKLPWLAWCHAMAMAESKSLPMAVDQDCDWHQLQNFLQQSNYVGATHAYIVGNNHVR